MITKRKFRPTHEYKSYIRDDGHGTYLITIPNEIFKEFRNSDLIVWRLNSNNRWEVIPFDLT